MTQIPEATPEQMREVDRIMVEDFGIQVPQMMELAGRVTAQVAYDLFKPREVLILAGKGNNGGDGLVAARHLHAMGVDVHVVLAGELHREVPLMQLETLRELHIPIDDSIHCEPDLIIDALLGFGSKGEPRGSVALLIKEATKLKKPVLSIDIPSGLEASTGKWFRPSFEGATVITLGLPKRGMSGDPRISRLFVGDIGIPPEAYMKAGLDVPILFTKNIYGEIVKG